MKNELNEPKSLQEAILYFSDPDRCLEYIVARRWPNGVCCPVCESKEVYFTASRRIWQCKNVHSKRQFSLKTGTIFEDSPIGMDKWMVAVWLAVSCKNGVSSYEVARDLRVTQQSAWFMMHRIRYAMQTGSFMKMRGEVEVDETFIGGKARNMHMA
jgi:Transposase zinc-ribbon domain